MFNSLTYKQKNKLLLVGSIVLCMLAYTLSIKKTITVYSEYKNLKNQAKNALNGSEEMERKKKELLQIDANIKNENQSNTPIRELILEFITTQCQSKNVVLAEFPQTIIKSEGDITIETNLLKLEGAFIPIIEIIYLLEQKQKIGTVSGVNYQLKKDNKTKQLILFTTIYLQNFKK